MQKSAIRPQFRYQYKSQAVILDSQYNFDGTLLAVSNSNGEVLFYESHLDDTNKQPIYTLTQQSTEFNLGFIDINKKNNAIIKIAWSDPKFNYFANATVQKTLTNYQYNLENKFSIHKVQKIKTTWIPISMCFCPIDLEVILTVGFSDGKISLFDQQLKTIITVQGHQESVNCLSWQNRIANNSKNQWILNNFPQLKSLRNELGFPLLLSCSSDMFIIIWKYKQRKLFELGKIKAHDKQIRQVQWKPNYFKQERMIVSCSQDCYVKLWGVKIDGSKLPGRLNESAYITKKSERNFNGPVYKASYNYMGSLIAVCYCVQQEEKIQTKIVHQVNGILQDLKKQ